MRRSKMLEKLRRDEAVVSVNISLSPDPLAIEIAGRSGIDGVWIDTEHRPFSQREVAAMINAGRIADIDCFVRIRKGEGYTSFFRPLEDGAAGIIVPHVATREEAEWVARNANFPPMGRRGMEMMMPDADLGFGDIFEYVAHANRETFVIIQIEDVEALDTVEEIAEVPGIDMFMIGPGDLSFSMGIPLQLDHPEFQAAVKKIAAAAAANGKWWGLPVGDTDGVANYYDLGARFFNLGGDYGMLKNGCLQVRSDFDRVMGNEALDMESVDIAVP